MRTLSKLHLNELEIFNSHLREIKEKGQTHFSCFKNDGGIKDKYVLITPNRKNRDGYLLTNQLRRDLMNHFIENGYLEIQSLPDIFMGELYDESLSPDVYLIPDYYGLISYIMVLKIVLPITEIIVY